jgi:hypothetical protein
VIADSSAQHGVSGLKFVKHRPLRYWTFDFESDLVADMGEGTEMEWKHNANHVSVSFFLLLALKALTYS